MDNLFIKFALGQLLWLVLAIGGTGLAFLILSLPWRRYERARFFLDLLETGLKHGRSPEHSIASLAQTRDASLGVRFHLLGAWIETGLRLGQALDQVPHFLPPRLKAMLQVGEAIGDLERVLPACRRQLPDGVSQSRSAVNYLMVAAFVLTPVAPTVLLVLGQLVFPKFEVIFAEMGVVLPRLTVFVLDTSSGFGAALSAAMLLVYGAAAVYLGGARLSSALEPVSDWMAWQVPWKRKRLQRDFSAMLATLLDAGVPESKAIQLAGESTANRVFERRVGAAAVDLRAGAPLAEALRRLDDSGQLRWRLANALQGRRGFFNALSGWLQALDAKAFQQEQAAAHAITTGLVIFNGLVVGTLISGIFLALVALIDAGVQW